MRKIIIVFIIIVLTVSPVFAAEFTAPAAPEQAQEYIPDTITTFGEGLWYVIKTAITKLQPSIAQAAGICISLIGICLLISLIQTLTGESPKIASLTGTVAVGVLLLKPTNTLIGLGTTTVTALSEYGKLLLPVMTAAMAAQGGATTSAALYTGTVLFDSLLSVVIARLIVPMLYMYLCLCVANSATGASLLKSIRDFIKWAMTWCLKLLLYVFTGYIGITGVVSGTADAAAVKAAKLAISGAVPVVGSILSDASETILVSAGLMKNTAGVYGVLAILATWIGPFIQIGIQYIFIKITAAICSVVGTKAVSTLVQDFSGAMGLVLAMTGTVCLFLLISIVCFMKGIG